MQNLSIKTRIMWVFLILVILQGICVSALGFYIIQKYIVDEAQKQVISGLKTVRVVYDEEIDRMKMGFTIVGNQADIGILKDVAGLDYIYRVNADKAHRSQSGVVLEAVKRGKTLAYTRIITRSELQDMRGGAFGSYLINLKETPRARPSERKTLQSVMSLECARPFFDSTGELDFVLYGGKIINKNITFIQELSDSVFESKLYNSKPIGTVTIFQDDIRVITTVLDNAGNRAIGTRVSDVVYSEVVEKGKRWLDRAFVVTDWYLTAYEPIRSIYGEVIGILYIGILEKPFIDLKWKTFMVFLVIKVVATSLAIALSIVLASMISRPITELRDATSRISAGDLHYRLKSKFPVKELNQLAMAFNMMVKKLDERERHLKVINEQFAALNRNYLDMLSFVSHELKGVLGAIVMNIFAVKDGFFGSLTEKQKKALDSAGESLEHFECMVKNYLDLSRIEK